MMFAAFFCRVMPASSIANPACMMNTSTVAIIRYRTMVAEVRASRVIPPSSCAYAGADTSSNADVTTPNFSSRFTLTSRSPRRWVEPHGPSVRAGPLGVSTGTVRDATEAP
jgi:hypothetical protein